MLDDPLKAEATETFPALCMVRAPKLLRRISNVLEEFRLRRDRSLRGYPAIVDAPNQYLKIIIWHPTHVMPDRISGRALKPRTGEAYEQGKYAEAFLRSAC